MCELDGEQMLKAFEPLVDPRDYFVSHACGRIERGEAQQMDVDDLREVVRWLNEEIHARTHPYIPEPKPF